MATTRLTFVQRGFLSPDDAAQYSVAVTSLLNTKDPVNGGLTPQERKDLEDKVQGFVSKALGVERQKAEEAKNNPAPTASVAPQGSATPVDPSANVKIPSPGSDNGSGAKPASPSIFKQMFSFFGAGTTGASNKSTDPQLASGGLIPPTQGNLTTVDIQRAAITGGGSAPLIGPTIPGNANPLSLPSVNWGSLTKSIGNAQNLTFGANKAAGGNFSSQADKYVGGLAGGLVGGAVGTLFNDPSTGKPSGPIAGLMAGALGAFTGAYASKLAGNWASKQVTQFGGKLNLSPVSQFLGKTLGLSNKTQDTFGFLFPSSPDYVDISLAARVTPLGTDGNIKYTKIPFIPTLNHHTVTWQIPPAGVTATLGTRKSQATASRMSFKLEGRNTIMSLLINPRQVSVSRSQVMSNAATRQGFVVSPTGPGEFDVHVTGTTAAFYEDTGGLTTRETNTVAYSNLLLLYNFFLNNGYIFDDETPGEGESSEQELSTKGLVSSHFKAPLPNEDKPPSKRINSMSYVSIQWQKFVWHGYFKTMKITDTSEAPYTLNFEFQFRVCHESDIFKIDNMIAGSKPPVTGHVDAGYSAERALASRVVGGPAPDVLQNAAPKHKNVVMNDFIFTDDSDPRSSLDPTRTLEDSALRLSLGGYSLNMQTGSDGMRFFGQGPDGTALALGGRGNERTLTMAFPGASPVSYLNVASQSQDAQGNPVVNGTVSIAPGDTRYAYTMPGSIPPKSNSGS